MYLLDTNVWVSYLRGKNRRVQQVLAGKPVHEIAFCSVVLAELFYGTLRSADPAKNRAAVDALVSPYRCLPFDEAAAEHFARIRYDLDALGMPIGAYDLQIAAIALAYGCTVVTHNTLEYSRVVGLAIEDWEAP